MSTQVHADTFWKKQQEANQALISRSHYMRDEIRSAVLPLHLDIDEASALTKNQLLALQALEIEGARTALLSLASLAKINELDHLGGGLDLIPALTLTLSLMDYEKREFTIENAHCSIGYYSTLAARGFLSRDVVIEEFRRGLDIPGHVSWVPGGTQLNGGRLGVMVPTAVGQALGKRARHEDGSWVICHCGDAGWISGQALNGFNGADLHRAPVTFVMHRNGIQLSGSNLQIMDKDPRPIIEALGITIVETPSLHEGVTLYKAYRHAYKMAQEGRPTLIYPTGFRSTNAAFVDLNWFGNKYGIHSETQEFANHHGVPMETEVWIPGALMSYRDAEPMLECLFLVNELPGGEGHHDGHMKGRDPDLVLSNPMLQMSVEQRGALDSLCEEPRTTVITRARPAPGTPNLSIPDAAIGAVSLPGAGEMKSARAGVEAGYAAVAEAHPDHMYVVSCDLDPSTKLGKARSYLSADHQFEMSIEEQASSLMADGLAMASHEPQLVVFSTFAAFFEGIAREGLEMWRYQRNLNGANEGLNVTFHMSHVGACTGRDHFSGWALDWVNLAMGYLPYLHRFYAPCDARAAFLAVKDLAAHYGAHIIAIPRDNLPVLAGPDGKGALYNPEDAWEAVTECRHRQGATRAIIALGAPAYLAAEASDTLDAEGIAADAIIVNGLPLPEGTLQAWCKRYPAGLVTIEDGLIGTADNGRIGLAGLVAGAGLPRAHIGIVDPRIAPSEGHHEVWAHFGITAEALVEAVRALG
jgi:transketolase